MNTLATLFATEFQDEHGAVPAALLDQLPLLASYVDRHLVYRFVNRTYERWYGVSKADMIGKTVGALSAQSARELQGVFDRVLAGETVRVEHESRFAVGLRTVEATFTPHFGPGGEVLGFFTFCEDLTAKRAAAAAVEGALDGLGDGFVRLDRDWTVLALNSAAERFYGVHREAVIGRPVEVIWPGAADSPSGALVARVMETGVPERAELESAGAPGKTFLIDVVPLADGGACLVLEDTTERRAMERELAFSEARFRSLVEALPGLVFLCDAQGNNSFVNEAFVRFTGRPFASCLGRGWTECVHPDDLARAVAFWETASETAPPSAEFRLRRADGAWRWHLCNTAVQRDDRGEAAGWVGTAIDIHDRKLAEEALAAKRDLLQAVVDTSPDPIFVKNTDGTYRVANAAVLQALNKGGPAIVGRRDRDFLPGPIAAALEAADRRVFAGETVVIEEIAEDLGPATRTFLSTKTPLRNGAGEIVGLVGVSRDISDRKDGERHRDLLIGELNHRVKNTLAVVQSIAAQTLRAEDEPRVALRAFEARLAALARAHDILVDHAWDVAPLTDLIARILAPFREAAASRFDLTGPEVRLEPRVAVALALALHELATNAVKYGALSGPSGRVSIRWRVHRGEAGAMMKLTWRESGGPRVTAPARRGFGSRLVERALTGELKGGARLEFDPAGVVCDLGVALPY